MPINNIVTSLLKELNVPFTQGYLRGYLSRLPLNNSLWAIHKVLNHYGLPNSSMRIDRKEDISALSVPFIAQTNRGLVTVRAVGPESVEYTDAMERHHRATRADFIKSFTGVVMRCKADADSAEPDIRRHVRAQRWRYAATVLTVPCLAFVASVGVSGMPQPAYAGYASVVLTAIGFGLSFMLAKKHLHIPSRTAEKLCGIVGNGKCDAPDSGGHSQIMLPGRIDLSEAGMAFFGVNLIACLAFPSATAAIIIYPLLLALPLSIWSIAWQMKHRSWCPLCVMVMTVIWCLISLTLATRPFAAPSAALIIPLATIGCAYWAVLQGIHRLYTGYESYIRREAETDGLHRMKFDRAIWTPLIEASGPAHPVTGPQASSLIFGQKDPGMPLITIVGNPFCAPCARMHRRVRQLLDAGFALQYVYTYFNHDLAPVNKQIVACYFERGADETWRLLTEWYEGDRERHIFNPANAAPMSAETEKRTVDELIKHDKWIELTGISATPTVLIDGKPIPPHYIPEDLLNLY